jgi:hypothetical protein
MVRLKSNAIDFLPNTKRQLGTIGVSFTKVCASDVGEPHTCQMQTPTLAKDVAQSSLRQRLF